MVVGFVVAGVYAVGMLRGRSDRYHQLGFRIPFTIAAVITRVQIVFGDTVARAVAKQQPQKFAAMELVQHTRARRHRMARRHRHRDGAAAGGVAGLGMALPAPDTAEPLVPRSGRARRSRGRTARAAVAGSTQPRPSNRERGTT